MSSILRRQFSRLGNEKTLTSPRLPWSIQSQPSVMKSVVWTEHGWPGQECRAEARGGGGVGGAGRTVLQERPPPTYIPCWEMRWARGYREMGHREPSWLRADSGAEIIRHVSFTPHNPFPMRDLLTDHFDQARFHLSTTYRWQTRLLKMPSPRYLKVCRSPLPKYCGFFSGDSPPPTPSLPCPTPSPICSISCSLSGCFKSTTTKKAPGRVSWEPKQAYLGHTIYLVPQVWGS